MSARLALVFAVFPGAEADIVTAAAEMLSLSDTEVVGFIRAFSEGRINVNEDGMSATSSDSEATALAERVTDDLNRLAERLHHKNVVDEISALMCESYGREPWSSPAPPEA